jgi:hypothetical protein
VKRGSNSSLLLWGCALGNPVNNLLYDKAEKRVEQRKAAVSERLVVESIVRRSATSSCRCSVPELREGSMFARARREGFCPVSRSFAWWQGGRNFEAGKLSEPCWHRTPQHVSSLSYSNNSLPIRHVSCMTFPGTIRSSLVCFGAGCSARSRCVSKHPTANPLARPRTRVRVGVSI